jgi:hypothetical protein
MEQRLVELEEMVSRIDEGVGKLRNPHLDMRLERDPVKEVTKVLRRLARPGQSVLAGPWCSEVGYELLYWIPFLRWAVQAHPQLRQNMLVVSRGGTEDWYAGIGAAGYADVFDHVDPGAFKSGREQATAEGKRKKQKQYDISTFDSEMLARVAAARGVADYRALHPSVMYEELRLLGDRGAHGRFDQIARYEPLPKPALGELEGRLPDDYVAVKFYFNYPLPASAETTALVKGVIERIARERDVVLLNTGMSFDDHWDFDPAASARVHRFDALMTPANNLRVQTAIISRARAFVGTYGGLSYLPPFFGVPSLSFYADWTRFSHHHLALAQRVFRGPGWGHFLALDLHQAPLLQLAQGAIDLAPAHPLGATV